MKKIKPFLPLLLIALLALTLRLYQVNEIPSFHADEADFANNAYSLLKTGRDQDGHFLPLGTTSTGDLRPAFYVYLAAAAIKVFGFNELATRLPTVLFSVLTVILLYFLADELFKNRKIALFASFFLAVSFWHITLSREASEKIVALFLVTLGLWGMFRYLHAQKIKYLVLTASLFFISIHTYYSPRFFLLAFLPIAYWFLRKKRAFKKNLQVAGILAILCAAIIFFTFFYSTSTERIKQLFIFNHPYNTAILGEQIREDGPDGQVFITRAFHNKLIAFSFSAVDNYLDYFSHRFFFTEGGYPERVRVPRVGLINLFELPFLLFGLYLLVHQLVTKNQPELKLLFWWLLASFLPAALTFDEIPNVYRTIIALPPLILITAYGTVNLFSILSRSKKLLIIFLSVCFLGYSWFFAYFLHQYFVHYEVHQPWYRNYAHKMLVQAIQKDYLDAKIIFVPQLYGGVEQMFRFYFQYDPVQYQKDSLTMDKKAQRFQNIQFIAEICPYRKLLKEKKMANSQDYVFVNAPECHQWLKPTDIVDQVITWRDGVPAYEIIKGKDELLKQ